MTDIDHVRARLAAIKKKKKKSIEQINKDAMDHNKAQDELDYETFR
jgi:hypothetical protein